MPRPRIAIFVDDADWHTRRLKRAFTAQGVEAVSLSLRGCGFEIGGSGHGLRLPGFADALPDGVFVRTISAGSFEQVTMRLGVLHALRELGVPVHNDARAIERCVDKSMTSFLLHKQGIADAGDLERRVDGGGAARGARGGAARAAAGAEAAVRLPGPRPAPDRRRRRRCRRRTKSPGSTTCSDSFAGARRAGATGACSSSAAAPSPR